MQIFCRSLYGRRFRRKGCREFCQGKFQLGKAVFQVRFHPVDAVIFHFGAALEGQVLAGGKLCTTVFHRNLGRLVQLVVDKAHRSHIGFRGGFVFAKGVGRAGCSELGVFYGRIGFRRQIAKFGFSYRVLA